MLRIDAVHIFAHEGGVGAIRAHMGIAKLHYAVAVEGGGQMGAADGDVLHFYGVGRNEGGVCHHRHQCHKTDARYASRHALCPRRYAPQIGDAVDKECHHFRPLNAVEHQKQVHGQAE